MTYAFVSVSWMSQVPAQPRGNTARSPAATVAAAPPPGVTVIAPARTWMNSATSSNAQRDGPGVQRQIPADWSPALHSSRPDVCISAPVASSSGPQSSRSSSAGATDSSAVTAAMGSVIAGSSRLADLVTKSHGGAAGPPGAPRRPGGSGPRADREQVLHLEPCALGGAPVPVVGERVERGVELALAAGAGRVGPGGDRGPVARAEVLGVVVRVRERGDV